MSGRMYLRRPQGPRFRFLGHACRGRFLHPGARPPAAARCREPRTGRRLRPPNIRAEAGDRTPGGGGPVQRRPETLAPLRERAVAGQLLQPPPYVFGRRLPRRFPVPRRAADEDRHPRVLPLVVAGAVAAPVGCEGPRWRSLTGVAVQPGAALDGGSVRGPGADVHGGEDVGRVACSPACRPPAGGPGRPTYDTWTAPARRGPPPGAAG
jgi:hypothetical protein